MGLERLRRKNRRRRGVKKNRQRLQEEKVEVNPEKNPVIEGIERGGHLAQENDLRGDRDREIGEGSGKQRGKEIGKERGKGKGNKRGRGKVRGGVLCRDPGVDLHLGLRGSGEAG